MVNFHFSIVICGILPEDTTGDFAPIGDQDFADSGHFVIGTERLSAALENAGTKIKF